MLYRLSECSNGEEVVQDSLFVRRFQSILEARKRIVMTRLIPEATHKF